MAQAIDTRLFFKGMNKDIDPRLLQEGEYIDAHNITINDALNGHSGAVSNIIGAIAKGGTGIYREEGDDSVIGMFVDNKTNCIYTFLYDAVDGGEFNRIVKYDTVSEDHSVVVISINLPFTSDTIIKSCDIIDGMIFWTDGENEPMMFNQNIDYMGLFYNEYNYGSSYSIGTDVYYKNILYYIIPHYIRCVHIRRIYIYIYI